jgi:hypothetical protein
MTRPSRSTLALLAAAAALALQTGCPSTSDCSVTPEVNQAPGSCSLVPDEPVTVNVRWCSCGATTTCDVRLEGGGIIQLEPVVNSCDAECPPNPDSCPADTVPCTFTIPGAGSFDKLWVIDGQNTPIEVPLTVTGAGSTVCPDRA